MFARYALPVVAVALGGLTALAQIGPTKRPEVRPPEVFPKVVDLRGQQTPLRNQGGRNTCIVHSVTAAMEAALGRAGSKNLDLSEDTFMYFVKLFWLGRGATASATEHQLGGTDGGNGVENLHYLSGGLAIPEARYGRADGYDYKLPKAWDDKHWQAQFNADSWTLSPKRLPTDALAAGRYFTVTSFKTLGATSVADIEAALRGGREVVWDFTVSGNRPGNAMWTHTGAAKATDPAHSMLIVGYDKTDPKKPFFIVKNSWGATTTPGSRGYTYISYDYLKYGVTAGVVTGVKQVAWNEVRFVGRWALNLDGWQGVLDVSHVPGVFQGVLKKQGSRTTDRRIGVFYENGDPKKAFRVNGTMKGNRIDFYIDRKNANPDFDKLGGQHFTYRLGFGDKDFMAGTHRDPDGRVWGGFARRLKSDAAFPDAARVINTASLPDLAAMRPASRLPKELKPESYLGTWKVVFDTNPVTITLTKRDDAAVPADKKATHHGLSGANVVLLVNKKSPMEVEVISHSTALKGKVAWRFSGRLLSWERGVAGGTIERPRVKGVYGGALVRGK